MDSQSNFVAFSENLIECLRCWKMLKSFCSSCKSSENWIWARQLLERPHQSRGKWEENQYSFWSKVNLWFSKMDFIEKVARMVGAEAHNEWSLRLKVQQQWQSPQSNSLFRRNPMHWLGFQMKWDWPGAEMNFRPLSIVIPIRNDDSWGCTAHNEFLRAPPTTSVDMIQIRFMKTFTHFRMCRLDKTHFINAISLASTVTISFDGFMNSLCAFWCVLVMLEIQQMRKWRNIENFLFKLNFGTSKWFWWNCYSKLVRNRIHLFNIIDRTETRYFGRFTTWLTNTVDRWQQQQQCKWKRTTKNLLQFKFCSCNLR